MLISLSTIEAIRMIPRKISVIDILLMIILITIWGSSFVVVKIALREGLTPISIATFRFLIAGALFVFFIQLANQRKRGFRQVQALKKDFPSLLVLALSGVTMFFTAQYTGIQMAGAAVAAILVCLLSPILISVFSVALLKESLRKVQAVGTVVAAVGTGVVISEGILNINSGKDFLIGGLILLSTPFLWTCYTLLGKKVMDKYNAYFVVAYTTILGGIMLLPLSLFENSLHLIMSLTTTGWLAILYLSFACSLFGYFVWFHVLRRVGPAITSSFLFAEPLITALLATFLVGELVTWMLAVGGLLIFLGVYLVVVK
jgi:drug/metabolite transporter (DMT)-like permease